jgi:hypothetical protein
MLDKLQAADFLPYVHQSFRVRLDGVEPINLELISVTEHEPASTQDPARRHPFSVMFLGPSSNLYLRQHIYHLEHEGLGELDIFIVPLGPQSGRMRYEAVFA